MKKMLVVGTSAPLSSLVANICAVYHSSALQFTNKSLVECYTNSSVAYSLNILCIILPGQHESAREILEGLCQNEESSNEHGSEEESGEVACGASEDPTTPSVRSRGPAQPIGVTPAAATPQRLLPTTRLQLPMFV